MESIQEREGKLEQLYKKLQQEWDAHKHSNPKTTRSRRYSHSVDHSNTIKAIQLLHCSPRLLMAKLQQYSSTTNDLAVQEIIQERREAIERGRLKGRCLFHPTDAESELGFLNNVTGQESEVRSLSFCSSEDNEHGNEAYHTHSSSSSSSSRPCLSHDFAGKEHEDMVDEHGNEAYHTHSSSSSSSSRPCLSHDFAGKEHEDMVAMVAEKKKKVANGYVSWPGIENGSRYIVFLGGITVALLLMFAVCMKSATSAGGYQETLVPT